MNNTNNRYVCNAVIKTTDNYLAKAFCHPAGIDAIAYSLVYEVEPDYFWGVKIIAESPMFGITNKVEFNLDDVQLAFMEKDWDDLLYQKLAWACLEDLKQRKEEEDD